MRDYRAIYFAMGFAAVLGVGAIQAGLELHDDGIEFPDGSFQPIAALGPWSQKLDSTDGDSEGCHSSRFKCVLGGEAVLDMETGLVWEKTVNNGASVWSAAAGFCNQETIGDRRGWRLAALEELLSLADCVGGICTLPPDHPFFVSLYFEWYWTSSTSLNDASQARVIEFDGEISTSARPKSGTDYRGFWCVRGGATTRDLTLAPSSSS